MLVNPRRSVGVRVVRLTGHHNRRLIPPTTWHIASLPAPNDLREIFLTTEQNLNILVQTATTIETSVDHNSFPVIIFTQNIGIHGTETWIVHAGNMHVTQTSSRQTIHIGSSLFYPPPVK